MMLRSVRPRRCSLTALTVALLGFIAAVHSIGCARGGSRSDATVATASSRGALTRAVTSAVPGKSGAISCGAASCRAGAEVCCSRGSDEACVARVPSGPGASSSERQAPQVQACEAGARSEYSLTGIAYCDDSGDCAAGQVCCGQWLWSGAGLAECVPSSGAGKSPCDFAEVCREGAPCVTPGTSCYRGACQLESARVACGGAVCGGATPICCAANAGDAPRCVAREACRPDPRSGAANIQYECSGPSTCAAGMHCLAGVIGSYCSNTVDLGTAAVVCESPSDCPPDVCQMNGTPGGRSRCVVDAERRLKICECG